MTETPTTPEAPLKVSRFEAHLLRLLRSLVDSTPAPKARAGRLAMPPGLSPECLHLVRDTLGKGIMLYLARAGGWRRERHLRDGKPAEGRLWERSAAGELGLSFSPHTISFLMALTAGQVDGWDPPPAELTVGDQFLFVLAYHKARDTMPELRSRRHIIRHGLLRLLYPEDFPADAPIDFAPWVTGAGAAILEALQPRLRERWLEVERSKLSITQWAKLRFVGQAQDRTLTAFLTACGEAKRPDLARFLLQAMEELLSRDLTPTFWFGGLAADDAPTRLAERIETQRFALAAVSQLEKLAGWTRDFAGTQFFDEDYPAAQLWLLDWEQARGEELAAIAQNLQRQIEPLRMTRES